MKFKIDNKIFEMFPKLKVSLVMCRNINNYNESKIIKKLFEDCHLNVSISEIPMIKEWKEIYTSLGYTRYKPPTEIIARSIQRGEVPITYNKLQDIANYIMAKYFVPVNIIDFDKIKGSIELTIAENEKPVLVIGEIEERPPKDGEIIYKDSESTIIRRFNWRVVERVKVTHDTKNAIYIIETFETVPEKLIDELKYLVIEECGGITEEYSLDKENPEIEITE
jgi:DNA/RNA-binding domain of Phe-tRNA-synthetase-like protein